MPDPPALKPLDKRLAAIIKRSGILGLNPNTPAGQEIARMYLEWYETAPKDTPEKLKQFAAERAVECELFARANASMLIALKSPKPPKRIPDNVVVGIDENGEQIEVDERAIARAEKKARLDAQAHNAAYNAAKSAYRQTISDMKDAVALMGLARLLNPKEQKADSPDFLRSVKEIQKRLGIRPSETVDAEFDEVPEAEKPSDGDQV